MKPVRESCRCGCGRSSRLSSPLSGRGAPPATGLCVSGVALALVPGVSSSRRRVPSMASPSGTLNMRSRCSAPPVHDTSCRQALSWRQSTDRTGSVEEGAMKFSTSLALLAPVFHRRTTLSPLSATVAMPSPDGCARAQWKGGG
jgi:hypothetical protein